MPEEEGIGATLAGALLQVRAIRGAMPDEKEAAQIIARFLKSYARSRPRGKSL
jgi:hypothetical protein